MKSSLGVFICVGHLHFALFFLIFACQSRQSLVSMLLLIWRKCIIFSRIFWCWKNLRVMQALSSCPRLCQYILAFTFQARCAFRQMFCLILLSRHEAMAHALIQYMYATWIYKWSFGNNWKGRSSPIQDYTHTDMLFLKSCGGLEQFREIQN